MIFMSLIIMFMSDSHGNLTQLKWIGECIKEFIKFDIY